MRISATIIMFLILLSCKEDDDKIIIKSIDPDINWVFTSNSEGYTAYRCPTLAISKSGTLFAFCEGRVDSEDDDGISWKTCIPKHFRHFQDTPILLYSTMKISESCTKQAAIMTKSYVTMASVSKLLNSQI